MLQQFAFLRLMTSKNPRKRSSLFDFVPLGAVPVLTDETVKLLGQGEELSNLYRDVAKSGFRTDRAFYKVNCDST